MNGKPEFYCKVPFWFYDFYESLSNREIFSQKNSAIIASTGKSREYISRLFKRATGSTFADYLNTRRIEHAASLLLHSKSDIIEISLECGFENLSTFYHLFKQKKGISPKLYRETFWPSVHYRDADSRFPPTFPPSFPKEK